jgi:hypothetical protein
MGTPRTDAAVQVYHHCPAVDIGFSRTMERELTEAQEEVARLGDCFVDSTKRGVALEAACADDRRNCEIIYEHIQALCPWVESPDMSLTEEIIIGLRGVEIRNKEAVDIINQARAMIETQQHNERQVKQAWEQQVDALKQAHAETLAKLADATNEDRNGMAEMRALVESMRGDSERLDYLELLHHPCQPETEDEVSHMSVTICLPMGEVLVRDVSVRAAIDSAREQAPKNGGDKP